MNYLLFFCSVTLLLCACSGADKTPEIAQVEVDPKVIVIPKMSFLDSLLILPNDSLANVAQEDTLKIETTTIIPQKLLLFEDNGLFGYKNEEGEVVLIANYEMATDFVDGMAEVVDGKGWAYINAKGEVIARPFIYDNGPDYFREGLARFVDNNKIGFITEKGVKKIAANFDFAKPFENGLSVVCNGCKTKRMAKESGEHWIVTGGKWGIINKKGDWVLPCNYDEVKNFGKGVVGYKEGGKWIKQKIND